MEFSHGLCFGRRQLTILTPQPLSFTSRLCLPSQRLTSLEMCQLALSQIRRRVFLPTLSSPSQHHERNRVLMELTGLPSTNLIPICPRAVEGVEAVAGYGLRLGVVFGDRLLDHARGLALLGEGAQSGQRHPAPPAFVQKADGPQRVGVGCLHQSVAPPFFRSYKGSGEVIHRLARCQRMPRRRERVARMVSPETLFSVRPSSKAASAAISRVHRLVSYPNSLGDRCSIPRSRSAEFASKAGYTRFGVEEPAMSASKPFSLKARMALRTVCEAHPRLSAILGGELPRALASSIWQRRITKVSLERSPASRHSRSFSDNFRTYIGGFMKRTIAHHTQPSLSMH